MRSIPRLSVASTAYPKSGPFPPRTLLRFVGTTNLSVTPNGPACPSRPSGWKASLPPLGLPVLRSISLCKHAVATTPVGPQVGSGCSPGTCDSGLPHVIAVSAPTLKFSRPAQRSLSLRPACSRSRLKRPFASEASAVSLPPLPPQLLPAEATVAGQELHLLEIVAFARCTMTPYGPPTVIASSVVSKHGLQKLSSAAQRHDEAEYCHSSQCQPYCQIAKPVPS